MDLHYLEYVVTLAEEENMSKAASLLHISQPTLSVFIRNLESELGLSLFVRSHKKMTLTPAGQLYVSECRRILQIKKELYANLEKMKKPQLRVATTISSIPTLLNVLSEYYQDYPLVSLVPAVIPAPQIDEAIENRTIDFAVNTISLNTLQKRSSKIAHIPVQKYELMLVISSDNPVFSRINPEKTLTPNDLELFRPLPFVSQLMGSSKAKYDLDVLSQIGITPTKLIPINEMNFVISSLINDHSYALIPYSRFSDSRIRMLHFSDNYYSSREILYLSERKLSPEEKGLIQLIEKKYKSQIYYYQL